MSDDTGDEPARRAARLRRRPDRRRPARHRRPRRPARAVRGPRGRRPSAPGRPAPPWWPSTCPAASTPTPGRWTGPAVRADVTVTFGAIKPGLLIDPGAGHAGTVELVDIGLRPVPRRTSPRRGPRSGTTSRELLPRPGADSDKYRRGVLGLLAGSDRFTGAALLSTGRGGARRGGHGPGGDRARSPPSLVRQAWPETVVTVHPDEATGTCSARSAGSRRGWPARAWAPTTAPSRG